MDRLRTFGIVAHIDAGKTTLTERILFDTGTQSWVGSVDDGTAAMDWMPAERTRGISITAAATRVAWGGDILQVVDTPGHVDFVAEVERCLMVIDGVVVLVDAVRGVESQTRAVWQQTVAAGLPRMVFVNKLDRTGADFDAVLEEVAEQLECQPVPLVVPLCDETGVFAGLGDAITGSVQWFEGKPAASIVPRLQAVLQQAHERLVEAAADCDDAVMAQVVDGGRVAPEQLRSALRAAFQQGQLVPVLGGAALFNRGVDWLLDAVVSFLPRVSELPRRGPWSVDRAGDESAPFCGLVFKVQHHDATWNYVRVVRGRLTAGATLTRGNRPDSDRCEVPELWTMRADRHEILRSAGPGEVVVVPGELGWRTGDTVCDAEEPVSLPVPKFPAPVLAVSFEPARAEDVGRLYSAVRALAIDDPTLRVAREHERIVVRGMGELHLEVVADMVRARTTVEFRVSKPRVDRRETVRQQADGEAELRALVAGEELSAHCALRITPADAGQPVAVQAAPEAGRDDADGPALVAAVLEELRGRLQSGLRVGPMHGAVVEVRSVKGAVAAEALLQQAASKALENAAGSAEVVELEPWVSLEIVAPTASSAAVLADLGQRGAVVDNVSAGRLGARFAGRAPLSRMLGYVTRLRSISKGLGQVAMRPKGFAPAAESSR